RALGHAGALPPARRAHRRRVGLPPYDGSRVRCPPPRPRVTGETAEYAEKKVSLRSLRARRLIVGTFLCSVLWVSPAFAQQTHLLVITGVPGDEEHAKQFAKWAEAFIDAAKKKDSVPDANITYLSDRRAARESVEKAVADIAARAKPN